MKKIVLILFLSMLVAIPAFSQVSRDFRTFRVLMDSTDGLGQWPAAGDCTWCMSIGDYLTGNELQGFLKIDSLDGAGTVLDDWSLLWRRHRGEPRLDSLQQSDGTGHGWTFAKVINDDNALVNFDGLTLIEGLWVNFYADFGGYRPRTVEWRLRHESVHDGSNHDDSAKVVLKFDEYWN